MLGFYGKEQVNDETPAKIIDQSTEMTQLRNILMAYTAASPLGKRLGFVQGMADLASTFLILLQDESHAFWCFSNLMERLKGNYSFDGVKMNEQLDQLIHLVHILDPSLYSYLEKIDALKLFSAYRWFLVLFRREFTLDETLALWEFILCERYTPDMHMFIALAILFSQKQDLMTLSCADEVVKVMLDVKPDLEMVLSESERIFLWFKGLMISHGYRERSWALSNVLQHDIKR